MGYDDFINILVSTLFAVIALLITKFYGVEYGVAFIVYFVVKGKPSRK